MQSFQAHLFRSIKRKSDATLYHYHRSENSSPFFIDTNQEFNTQIENSKFPHLLCLRSSWQSMLIVIHLRSKKIVSQPLLASPMIVPAKQHHVPSKLSKDMQNAGHAMPQKSVTNRIFPHCRNSSHLPRAMPENRPEIPPPFRNIPP